MGKRGIVSLGAYIPSQRLTRKAIADAYAWLRSGGSAAKGSRAVSVHDEDSITQAVEAAANSLRGVETRIKKLFFASTTMPFSDRQNSTILAEALSLDRNLHCADVSGSLKVGLSALRQALESNEDSLVVASEKRLAKPASPQELLYGDGSAALVVGNTHLLAEYIGGYALSVDMIDHYRARESDFDYTLEDRWVREEGHLKIIPESINGLLSETGNRAEDIDHVVLYGPDQSTKQKIAKICGLSPDRLANDYVEDCGNTGTAHPLLMLADAIQQSAPGQLILVAGFAQGCDSLLFRATDQVENSRHAYATKQALQNACYTEDYIKYLSMAKLLEVDWGIRAERDNRTAHSAFYRQREAITGFIGGRCEACNVVQFPRARVCVNPECGATDTQVAEPFRDKAAYVKSFTQDWLAHCLNPPFVYGNVAFEGGGEVMMELVNFKPDQLKVGAPVEMVFRIKDRDPMRGFHRYFWKASHINTTL